MTEIQHTDLGELFFCLADDGLIYALGHHGDFYAAEDTAQSLGLSVIWIMGEECARASLENLKNNLEKVTQ